MGTLYVFFECNGIEIASFAGEKGGNHHIGVLRLPLFTEEGDTGFGNRGGEKPGKCFEPQGVCNFFPLFPCEYAILTVDVSPVFEASLFFCFKRDSVTKRYPEDGGMQRPKLLRTN